MTANEPSAEYQPRGLRNLSFLHMVPSVRVSARETHAHALELFETAERLGYDSGWVFVRHLQQGLSSPAAFLSAASQRTSRLGLGAAVIPLEYERLLTLAEGLATADVLSDGRVEAGLSVHEPGFSDGENDVVFGAGWRSEDYGYDRLTALRELFADAAPLVGQDRPGPGSLWSGRLEPAGTSLGERLWQGGGSLRSVRSAGRNGFNLLLSNIATAIEDDTDFRTNQRNLIRAYRELAPPNARVKIGLVVVPTDEASSEQRARFTAYLEERADRADKVLPDRLIIGADFGGSAAQIVSELGAYLDDVGADEFMAILPFTLELEDYAHILTVIAERIAPPLGWVSQR